MNPQSYYPRSHFPDDFFPKPDGVASGFISANLTGSSLVEADLEAAPSGAMEAALTGVATVASDLHAVGNISASLVGTSSVSAIVDQPVIADTDNGGVWRRKDKRATPLGLPAIRPRVGRVIPSAVASVIVDGFVVAAHLQNVTATAGARSVATGNRLVARTNTTSSRADSAARAESLRAALAFNAVNATASSGVAVVVPPLRIRLNAVTAKADHSRLHRDDEELLFILDVA
jgi:hypothetical protein